MGNYRWTRCVAAVGLVFLIVWGLFMITVRALNVPVAKVQPEAFALIAMMTAPFALGAPVVAALAAAGVCAGGVRTGLRVRPTSLGRSVPGGPA